MATTMLERSSYSAEVAANVRAELARAGIRQVRVREQLGLSAGAASARYNAITPWTIEELAGLARMLGVEVGDLLPRLDSNQKPAD